MRYRDYKNFSPNYCYHVYNRGNNKQEIFLDDEDRKFFLYRLKENLFPNVPLKMPLKGQPLEGHLQGKCHTSYKRKLLPPDAFSLLSYTLMPNHFHFEIRQNTDLEINKLLSKLCIGYSIYFNKKYLQTGQVFQDQFKAVSIENDSQLLWLSAYIHNNPKTAGLVKNSEDYLWSSYPDYIGKRSGILCDKSLVLKIFDDDVNAYKKFVDEAYDKIKERKDLQDLFLD